jgi:hypothetical protein
MASMTTNRLRKLLLQAASGSPALNLLSDTIKVMLVDASYVPNPDHNFVDSITGGSSKELSGTGYAAGFGGAGRKTLASKTITQDDANDLAYFDAADVTWTGLNAGTVGFAVLIKEVTSDADSPILCIVDVTPDVTTAGNDYTIQWPTGGIFNLGDVAQLA